ncbi:hypothetical protein HMPREF7545_0153, partial [Selenomonas noxia ATCC 43541]
MSRKVLLLEPDYKNKYPPMPLMKLATYFRRRGDDVRFFKGDLRDFAAQLLVEELYCALDKPDLARYFDALKRYVRRGTASILEDVRELSEDLAAQELAHAYYLRYKRRDYPQFDLVAVTTLFTFYWAKTIDTINDAKAFVHPEGRLLVGGVAATILPAHIKEETGVDPYVGLLDRPGMIDEDGEVIDTLPLDYSILEEIDYTYPAHDAYFGYMTRGCIRNCPFCAVKTLEPKYKEYIGIAGQLGYIEEHFGAQRDLLLMDNNVFASARFFDIIEEIKAQGFQKGAHYTPSSPYEVAISNLRRGHNVRGYLKKMLALYEAIAGKLKDEEAGAFYLARERAGLLYLPSAERENALAFDVVARPLYEKYFKRTKRKRALDFNQGLDARLVTSEKMARLAETAINPLRIAFDHYEAKDVYVRAIRMAAASGIDHLSNYLLYNYEDQPEELYLRMRINVDLCDELDVAIYSFPMKYHPIRDPKYFRNRDFIGVHWNRKFIRAVQAVLNATKGKIGRGRSFFEEAFGHDIEGFFDILWMPETFIIERMRYKENLTKEWRAAFLALEGGA